MDNAKHVRIFCDDIGESHFEDMETELIFMDFAPPAAPLAIAPLLPATKIQWMGAPTGWEGDEPHPVPSRSVFVVTQGEFVVSASDGDTRTFSAGSVLLLEDTWGKGHRTWVTSDIDGVVLVVSLADSETSEA
tara:strand:- start:51 stop:449 length:399 start_codon:yes stop_codon:yes gene_type:complete